MSKANRVRVDYMPGPAALLALEAAQSSFAKISQLSLFDYIK